MNRISYICLLLLILSGCTGEYYSDAVIATVEEAKPAVYPENVDTLFLDLHSSEIAWKGTKMWGRGMHSGTVPVREGYLLLHNKRLSGGSLIADMTNIGITDIPPDQPEPIQLLTGHLEDEVFFDVAKYPKAFFSITDITYRTEHELIISGNLSIKSVIRHITIPASVDSTGRQFNSRFRINRFNWNIAYRGGFGATRFAARNFVDKYIELETTIIVKK